MGKQAKPLTNQRSRNDYLFADYLRANKNNKINREG